MVPVNYMAVVAAAIVGMIIGYVWYGPLFGKQWMALMGLTPEKMAEGKKKMGQSYGIMFIGSLLMAFVLSHALIFAADYLGTSGVSAGLQTGFWNWLGFVAPVSVGSVLWDGKPWKLWFITSGYYLVTLCVMGVLLALWA